MILMVWTYTAYLLTKIFDTTEPKEIIFGDLLDIVFNKIAQKIILNSNKYDLYSDLNFLESKGLICIRKTQNLNYCTIYITKNQWKSLLKRAKNLEDSLDDNWVDPYIKGINTILGGDIT